MSWQTPKTDWTASDYFELSDYERIRGNLLYLQKAARLLYPPVAFSAMQEYTMEDLPYLDFWRTPDENLSALLAGTFCRPLYEGAGDWRENGPVWDDDALNRIESACLHLYEDLQVQAASKQRLAFQMGGGIFGACI